VVLSNLDKRDHGAPLHRMNEFDIMRMFYVARSRAKTLLALAYFKRRGVQIFPPFKAHLDGGMPRLATFNLASLPAPTAEHAREQPRVYSFTADYLLYQKCPRQYMIFRKFGFMLSQATWSSPLPVMVCRLVNSNGTPWCFQLTTGWQLG